MNQLELRDIHLPEAALWWPPAPGWWFLLVVIVILIFITPWLYRLIRRRSMKKRSSRTFSLIRKRFQQNADQRLLLADLSSLLRRVMMTYQGRQQIAGLTGDEWVKRMAELTGKPCFSEEQLQLLSRGQYAREIKIDHQALLKSCERWINALPRGSSDVSV